MRKPALALIATIATLPAAHADITPEEIDQAAALTRPPPQFSPRSSNGAAGSMKTRN